METLIKNHKVMVNGAPMEIPNGLRVADLLLNLDLKSGMVAVELNAQIVPKTEYDTRVLVEGDVLEIVHFVGGG